MDPKALRSGTFTAFHDHYVETTSKRKAPPSKTTFADIRLKHHQPLTQALMDYRLDYIAPEGDDARRKSQRDHDLVF